MNTPDQSSSQNRDVTGYILAAGLCLLPWIAALSPRFFAFAPALLAMMSLLAFRKNFGHWPQMPQAISISTGLIATLCVLSSLWSFDTLITLERALRIAAILASGSFLCGLMASLPAAQIKNLNQKMALWFPCAVITAGVVVLLDLYAQGAVYNLLRGGPDEELNYSRMNRSVVALSFLSLFAVYFTVNSKQSAVFLKAGILIGLAGVFAAIVIATQSQSAQMALLVAGAVYALFPSRARGAWFALGLGLIVTISLAPWIAQGLFANVAAQVNAAGVLAQAYPAPRMEIWDFIARKTLDNPIFGFGLEATRDIPRFDTLKLYNPVDHVLHPHNAVLQIWIEFGAIGTALLCGIVAVILRAIFLQPLPLRRFLLALFSAAFAVASTSYGIWQGWWIGLFMMMLVMCAMIAEKAEAQSD